MTKSYVVNGGVVAKCFEECPYFGDDGAGPGPVMACQHPDFPGRGYERCIISHPQCDTGFPEKCPLKKDGFGTPSTQHARNIGHHGSLGEKNDRRSTEQ